MKGTLTLLGVLFGFAGAFVILLTVADDALPPITGWSVGVGVLIQALVLGALGRLLERSERTEALVEAVADKLGVDVEDDYSEFDERGSRQPVN